MMRKILWAIFHPIYENRYTKGLVSKVINLFKPDFVWDHGNKIYIDKDDRVVSLELILSGKWEEFERGLFEQSIKAGDTVIDIGAHIGTYTLLAARKVGPKGRVYAFEPFPKNFQLLKKSVEANGYKNVVLINKAVSDKNTQTKLFLSNEDNFGDQRTYGSDDGRKFIMVETVTLDSILGDKKVNVIKMDIQGGEKKALLGSIQILKRNKLKLVTEFWPKGLTDSGSTGAEYLNFLKDNKFRVFEINDVTNTVITTSFQKLVKDYPKDSMFNTNLLCIKS